VLDKDGRPLPTMVALRLRYLMAWKQFRNMSDQELTAIHAYLHSLATGQVVN